MAPVQLARASYILRINAPCPEVAFLTPHQTAATLGRIALIRSAMGALANGDEAKAAHDRGFAALQMLAEMWGGKPSWPRDSLYATAAHECALSFELILTSRAIEARLVAFLAEQRSAAGLEP